MKKITEMLKNKNVITLILVSAVTFGCLGGAVSLGASSTDDDPLVSLSYINDVVIPDIRTYIDERIAEMTPAENDKEPSEETPELPPEEVLPENVKKADSYVVLELFRGQSLYSMGSLEIILRSGEAIVVSPFEDQGIADMSTGGELLADDIVPRNHYCLIPRADERGITVTGDSVFVMVRGMYEVR